MNQCIICNKPLKVKRSFYKSVEYPELLCVRINTSHNECQKAYDKVEKLKRELVDAEFALFLINHQY